MTDKVYIFDTTLRDGEQSAGVGFTIEDKLEVARALGRMNVDIIEAGFPISSPGDLAAVSLIAREVKGPVIAGLARAANPDIDACWEAVRNAETPRIHVFISSSEIHMAHQLRKNREDVIEMARASVARAKKYVSDVEFSPMDATRSDPEFVYQIVQAAIEEGATTVNIPDTVGYAIPRDFEEFIRNIRKNVPDIDKARISVHCHNDLGMAVANSLAGVKIGGARQVECTINGLGERAGNTSLEEVVMAVRTRRDHFGLELGIDTSQIVAASRLVSQTTGFVVQPNKAVVGANAFAHASGIHQDGVLKARDTYEIMRAEDVGAPWNPLVLGKHSGRHAVLKRCNDLGLNVETTELVDVYRALMAIADDRKVIEDADVVAVVTALRAQAATGAA